MALHRPTDLPGIYFITFTSNRWLPLIELTNGYDLVYNWFDILGKNGHCVTAFVIMPNHLHLLLYFNGGEQSLNTVIGNGKRFLAYDLVKRLKLLDRNEILKLLQRDVTAIDKGRGKRHEIWRKGFDVKECRTEDFIRQKLIYIHNNPCSGKWKLADDILRYPYSSACFYISGKKGNYPVRDYREFMKFGE
jgi:REP element-mobilizing transposase RayT